MLSELVRNLGVYLLLFSPLEHWRPLHRQLVTIKRSGFLTDLGHYFLTQGIAFTLLGIVWQTLTQATYIVGLTQEGGLCTNWPWWVQLSFMVLSNEVVAYFFHRACHTFSFLWKFHAIHHSSEQLDWLAAVRFHPLEIVMSRSLKYLPLAFVGFSFGPFGLFLFFDTLQGYFIHANLRFRLKWLSWLVVTPQFHHWHHSLEVTDKNFGGLLPWLDLLFGTFYLPYNARNEITKPKTISVTSFSVMSEDEWPKAYGIDAPIGQSYGVHLIYPFISYVKQREGTSQ